MKRAARSILLGVASLLVAWGLAACGSTEPTALGDVAAAQEAPANGAALPPAEFAAAATRAGTTVIDVRTPTEYADGHLPGAINFDVEGPNFQQQVGALDPAGSYALYCRSGRRSAVALQYLQQVGLQDVYHLEGGVQEWTNAGFELTED